MLWTTASEVIINLKLTSCASVQYGDFKFDEFELHHERAEEMHADRKKSSAIDSLFSIYSFDLFVLFYGYR